MNKKTCACFIEGKDIFSNFQEATDVNCRYIRHFLCGECNTKNKAAIFIKTIELSSTN